MKLEELYKTVDPNFEIDNADISFIQNKIEEYRKDLLHVSDSFKDLDSSRIKHIISVYLMGRILYEKSTIIRDSINEILPELFGHEDRNNVNVKFEFLWMLTSLYHDVGYVEENNSEPTLSLAQELSKYNYPSQNRYIPELYTDELINRYAWYRFITSNKYDHGIIGAQRLYEDLLHSLTPTDFRKEPKVYQCVCMAVACHNIWFPNDDTYGIYQAFGLNGLANAYRDSGSHKIREIRFSKHPILFLLSLADNIEPVKKTRGNSYADIDFEITDKSIVITTCNSKEYSNYVKSICDLDKWLTDVIKKKKKLTIVLDNSAKQSETLHQRTMFFDE